MPFSSDVQRAPVPTLVPQGDHAGQRPMTLNRVFTLIGSAPSARLYLPSKAVSRCHAVVINADTGLFIRDLASRTFVLVNGHPTREADLHDGDLVQIGPYIFRFTEAAGARPRPAPAAPPTAALEVEGLDQPIPIAERLVLIGRRETADVSLTENSASSAHAVIIATGGRHVLRDLNSRTGSFVNGAKVHEHVLSPGDTVRLGDTTMRFARMSARAAFAPPVTPIPEAVPDESRAGIAVPSPTLPPARSEVSTAAEVVEPTPPPVERVLVASGLDWEEGDTPSGAAPAAAPAAAPEAADDAAAGSSGRIGIMEPAPAPSAVEQETAEASAVENVPAIAEDVGVPNAPVSPAESRAAPEPAAAPAVPTSKPEFETIPPASDEELFADEPLREEGEAIAEPTRAASEAAAPSLTIPSPSVPSPVAAPKLPPAPAPPAPPPSAPVAPARATPSAPPAGPAWRSRAHPSGAPLRSPAPPGSANRPAAIAPPAAPPKPPPAPATRRGPDAKPAAERKPAKAPKSLPPRPDRPRSPFDLVPGAEQEPLEELAPDDPK